MNIDESPLDLENRRVIYQFIEKFPGIHFRELFRKVDISMGSLEYHLKILEDMDLVYLKKESGFTRYFVKGKLGEEDKVFAMMLRNDRLRKMLFTLILSPGLTHKNLSKKLGWPKSTTSFYLKKLLVKKVVEERIQSNQQIGHQMDKPNKGIYVIRPDKIVHLVLIYKSGFFDELTNRILDLVEIV